jgi:hypothetical protein
MGTAASGLEPQIKMEVTQVAWAIGQTRIRVALHLDRPLLELPTTTSPEAKALLAMASTLASTSNLPSKAIVEVRPALAPLDFVQRPSKTAAGVGLDKAQAARKRP